MPFIFDGVTAEVGERYGTVTAGATTTTITDTSRSEPSSTLNGLLLKFITGANANLSRPVVGNTQNASVQVSPGFPNAPSTGDRYVLISDTYVPGVPNADVTTNSLPRDITGNKSDAAAYAKATTKSIMAYQKGVIDGTFAASGTLTGGGTTSSHLDTARAEASNYWGGAILLFLTGPNAGLSRFITGNTSGVSISTRGFPNASTNGDTYVILVGRPSQELAATADGTASTYVSDITGNKNDAAQTTVSTTRSIMAYTKGLVNTIGGWAGVTANTFAMANNLLEQDVFAVTGITTPTQVIATLDLVNAAQGKTIRVYEKVDGTNYRSVDPEKVWTTSDEDGVRIEFMAQHDYKITLQNTVAEGINVPYRHNRRVTA